MEEKTTTKNWLQRLKDESWEAELLVSAIAIFGTFKLFDFVNWGTNFFINTLNPDQYFVGYFISFFSLIAVSALTSMFVIHFVLRAYWVGLVGLNSVFPDYSLDDSAYSKIYTEKILAILPKLKDSIQKVDELCSVIFSVAFTFLFMFGYCALFTSLYLLVYNILSSYIPGYILLIPGVLIFIGLYTQVFFSIIANMKKNKEKVKLQSNYFILVKYVSIVLFGPLYKSILQITMIFGSNFKKKKELIRLILLFFIGGIVVSGIQLRKTNIFYLVGENNQRYFDSYKTYSNYYKDTNDVGFLLAPEIQSDKINDNVLEVFIPVFRYEGKMREDLCGKDQSNNKETRLEQREANSYYLKECYKQYHNIYLNGNKVETDFLRYDNHYKTNQFGLLCFIDISKLPKGIQELKIEKINKDGAYLKWNIPFYNIGKNN